MTPAAPHPRHGVPHPRRAGFLLIEVLIGIAIFSVGVLAIVKLQATSVQQASGAGYRSMASLLANDLISQMWASDKTTLQTNFSSPSGPLYTPWQARVYASGLPNASASAPSVTIVPISASAGAASKATVTIYWKAPGDTDQHNFTAVAQLKAEH